MPKLLEQVREHIRLKHYSIRTDKLTSIGREITSFSTKNGSLKKWEWSLSFSPIWR